MGYTDDSTKVRGDLFTESGKWKYTVVLDFDGGDYENWDLWTEAKNALARATDAGISGVRLREVPHGWALVVLEPYSRFQYPITVVGRDD